MKLVKKFHVNVPLAWTSQAYGGGQTNRQTDKWTNELMNGWNFSPFYRISSPIGAAAQKVIKRRFWGLDLGPY